MSGKWDDRERKLDEECDAHGGGHNHGTNHKRSGDAGDGDDGRKGWTPRHHDPQPPDNKKIFSVTEASRLHNGKDIHVKGVISGIQPLRKMIKGVSCQCLECNTTYETKYAQAGTFSELCSY